MRRTLHKGFTLIEVLVALAMFAVFDYACRCWRHRQSLKMTDMEMREEIKTREGDPNLRRQRQQRHRKLADGQESLDAPADFNAWPGGS